MSLTAGGGGAAVIGLGVGVGVGIGTGVICGTTRGGGFGGVLQAEMASVATATAAGKSRKRVISIGSL